MVVVGGVYGQVHAGGMMVPVALTAAAGDGRWLAISVLLPLADLASICPRPVVFSGPPARARGTRRVRRPRPSG